MGLCDEPPPGSVEGSHLAENLEPRLRIWEGVPRRDERSKRAGPFRKNLLPIRMRVEKKPAGKPLQWRLEQVGHSVMERAMSLLPGAWVFRIGEALGAVAWHFMSSRRRIVLRNLRIALAGELELPEIHQLAKDSFCRTAGNMFSTAHTSLLPVKKLSKVLHIENLELLEQTMAGGRGVVLLLSHMGNWELLSRIVNFFPKDTQTGAFYQPLSNPLLDERIQRRREADGTRMFSKRDSFHHVTGLLRQGGVVGILADQRVGIQGDLVPFFGRLTRCSPLPALLAKRSKSSVLALSLVTEAPGKWRARFMPVPEPADTAACMRAMEAAMKRSLVDVFWFQDRWRLLIRKKMPLATWIGAGEARSSKRYRVLVWGAAADRSWQLPPEWQHPEVDYEYALGPEDEGHPMIPEGAQLRPLPQAASQANLQGIIEAIDLSEPLPLDMILVPEAQKPLFENSGKLQPPVFFIP